MLTDYVKPCIEKVEPVVLDANDPDKVVYIAKNLYVSHKKELTQILMKNNKLFAYLYTDIPGIY